MSASQQTATELDRWPESWYIPADKDTPKRLVCVARGCNFIFQTNTDIRYRWNHWQTSSSSKMDMTADHCILRALNGQRNCPYADCNYSFDSKKGQKTIRDLFQHEWDNHGTKHTTSIEGIVTLVRQGRLQNVTPELEEMIFHRMCQILKTTVEYRVALQYCNLPPHTLFENLKTLLSPEEFRPKGPSGSTSPYYIPLPADFFLLHLAPNPFDIRAFELDWETHWNTLRAMYASGTI